MVRMKARLVTEEPDTMKSRIHNFRIPLSPTGRRIMGFIYFAVPLVSGYFLMEWIKARNEITLKPELEKKLDHNKHPQVREQNEALEKLLQSIKEKKDRESSK